MSYGNAEALRATILEQAERDCQRVIHEAESQAHRIIAQAEMAATAQKVNITEHAEAVALDLQREARGSARLEAQSIKVRRREALLDEVFRRAAEALAEADVREDYPDAVADLVLDAARQLAQHGGDSQSLVIFADDVARQVLGPEMLRRLADDLGRKLSLRGPLPQTPEARRLGVILETEDGRLRYDNTLPARLARMRGALRVPVFRVLTGEGS
jgi:vacuolar-type H+-ATPase subunit E/Vma4